VLGLEVAALGEKRAVLRGPLKTPCLKTREEAKRVPPWVTACARGGPTF